MNKSGMKTKAEMLAGGVEWRVYRAKRVAEMVATDPTLSPVQRFDILTYVGYKLNLMTSIYYWPED